MRTPASWLGAALAVALIALAGCWWVTSGDWRAFEPLNFGNVYEAQTSSLLAGRTDIDCAIATGEAFVRDGKCYVYFGPVPGFIRWPVLWLAPHLSGQLGRPMVWLAQLLFLFIVVLMLIEAGHPVGTWSSTFYLLLTAFGSTIPYMWGWPLTYAEAITWAVALAAASLYCLLRWSRHGETAWIIGACLLAILAFFTRANTGAGLMAAVGFAAVGGLRRGPPDRRAQSAAPLILLGLAACLFVALNHARMGTYLNAVPIQLHVQYDAERLARVGGTLFHPEMGPPILMNYLFNPPHFRGGYPWLEYAARPLFDLRGMDIVELHTGVLPMMPALVWLAWAGWRGSRVKRELYILLSPLLGISLLVMVVAINQRYLHEFLLLLAPAGVYGLTWAMATRPRRRITYILSAWSIYACWALALVGQREVMYWVSRDAYDRHCAMRSEVDQLLGGRPISSLPGAAGRMRLVPSGSIYEFDGAAWQRCAGPPAYLFRIRIRFSPLPERAVDLLAVGKRPEANTLTLERGAAPGRYRVRMDHPGLPSESGPEFELQADRDYLFECEFHRINGQMRVKLDGVSIGQRRTGPLSWIENEVTAGPPGKWVQD